MKNTIKLILIGLCSLASVAANAAVIDGSLGIGGAYQASGGTDLSDAAQITLDTVWATAATGDIVGTVDASTPAGSGGTALLAGFTPVSGFFTVGPWSFDLDSLTVVDQTATLLTLEGTGTLFLDGESAGHSATWSFSAENATSYSMTVTTVVPVPAAVWLFGSGLLGLVGVARRKA